MKLMRAWEDILGFLEPEDRLTRTHEWGDPHEAEVVLWEREAGRTYQECALLAGCTAARARAIVLALEPGLDRIPAQLPLAVAA